jgi:hypothetical protein
VAETDILPISTLLAPTPGGHYAQGIQYGNLLFVSGQLPIRPDGAHLSNAPFETQCRQALTNLFGAALRVSRGDRCHCCFPYFRKTRRTDDMLGRIRHIFL